MAYAARPITLICLILIMGIGFARPCAAVTLRSDTEVNRPTVKLSDVFDQLPDGIDCDIARAPAPGKNITYNVNVLTHLAQQYKLDWQPQNISDHTTITTAATKLTADDIRGTVIEKIKALDIKGDIDVMFDNRTLGVMLPADRPPNFILNNFSFDETNRRFRSDLIADGFSGPVNLAVSGRIVVRKNIPVLVRRLESGSMIGSTDIDWVSIPEERLSGIVTNAEQLIGFELRRDADANQPVRESDVMPPRLVARGTLVTMKIETPVMTVTAQGRALQDGKRGDVVRITNTQSNRTVEGIVESASIVRILPAQKIATADAGRHQE